MREKRRRLSFNRVGIGNLQNLCVSCADQFLSSKKGTKEANAIVNIMSLYGNVLKENEHNNLINSESRSKF